MSPQPIETTAITTTTDENQPFDPRAKGALKHGLTGARLYLETEEEREAYANLRSSLLEDLAPSGDMETNLVLQIVSDRYRLERAASIESLIFHDGCPEVPGPVQDKLGRIWLKESKQIALLGLYESRIHRRFEKNMDLLEHLQTKRKSDLDAAIEEAALVEEAAESEPELAADPAEPFRCRKFDFSDREIAVMIDRYRRLRRVFLRSTQPAKRTARPEKVGASVERAA